MNLGIILSVSNYRRGIDSLPGCKRDGEAMETILRNSGKFEDILYLSEQTDSVFVKAKIIEFCNKHKASIVDDFVFYYSGHGLFDGDEFYYPLSDFEKDRTRQTSLQNTELDQLLKAVTPKLTIKIVDACNSGTLYIKKDESFEKLIKVSSGNFNKCYFMFSSQQDQYSYQDKKLSYFTATIIDAVLNHSGSSIRYKDLIDYISDAFASRSDQTPLFVTQADFTEIFCDLLPELKTQLTEMKADSNAASAEERKQEPISLVDIIAKQAAEYSTEQEAHQSLKLLFDHIKSRVNDSEILSKLYKFDTSSGTDLRDVPRLSIIGDWLVKNKTQPPIFAQVKYEDVEVQKRVRKDMGLLGSASMGMFHSSDDDEYYKTVTRIERQVVGFTSTVESPISYIKLSAEPLYPNLPAAACFVVPLLLSTKIYSFFAVAFYVESGWKNRRLLRPKEWLSEEAAIKSGAEIKELGR